MARGMKRIPMLVVIALLATLTSPTFGGETQAPAAGARGARAGGAFAGQRRGRGPMQVDPEAEARVTALGSRGVNIHDPSTIVKCKDTYWIFYTGGRTPSYYSKDLVTWQRGPAVFQNAEAPAWQTEAVPNNRRMDFWAPDIVYLNGKYLLFFSVSSFGVNTSAIGVTTNTTLDPNDPAYEWTEAKLVVTSDPNCDYNAIDPGVIVDQQGRLWMSFGSFWSGIQLIELNPDTGERIAEDSPMTKLAYNASIEAPHIYYHDGYYYLLLDWGMCCRGVRSTYEMRMGRSKEITGPYLDKEGKDMLDNGGTPLLATDGAFIGPGHPGIYKDGDKYIMGMHFYNGARNGASQYAIRPLKWDSDGWPVIVTPEEAAP